MNRTNLDRVRARQQRGAGDVSSVGKALTAPSARPPQTVMRGQVQVLSSYETLPLNAVAFSILVKAGEQYEDNDESTRSWWDFRYRVPDDRVAVLRSIMLMPEFTRAGTDGVPGYSMAPPGSLDAVLMRNGSAIPHVGELEIDTATFTGRAPIIVMGKPWSVHAEFAPGHEVHVRVSSVGSYYSFADGSPMHCLIEGELLWSRNLPIDLERGHEVAPLNIFEGGRR